MGLGSLRKVHCDDSSNGSNSDSNHCHHGIGFGTGNDHHDSTIRMGESMCKTTAKALLTGTVVHCKREIGTK